MIAELVKKRATGITTEIEGDVFALSWEEIPTRTTTRKAPVKAKSESDSVATCLGEKASNGARRLGRVALWLAHRADNLAAVILVAIVGLFAGAFVAPILLAGVAIPAFLRGYGRAINSNVE